MTEPNRATGHKVLQFYADKQQGRKTPLQRTLKKDVGIKKGIVGSAPRNPHLPSDSSSDDSLDSK
eukprot:m.186496 g.186496  ORF g.186496 m.186496 type:complete len:65 (-) comp15054_c1_seq2:16-210(-)